MGGFHSTGHVRFSLIRQQPPRLWESGNPAEFAGFPSEAGKSVFGLFRLASFPQPQARRFFALQWHSFPTVVPETLGTMSNRESSVPMLMPDDRAPGQRGAPAHAFNL